MVHIARLRDGRVAEMWDIGQEVPAESPNALGMFCTSAQGFGQRRQIRRAARSHHAGDFDAIAQQDERWPKLDLEAAAQRTPAPILDAHMRKFRMGFDECIDRRTRRHAMSTPVGAEVEQQLAARLIDFVAI